MPKKKTKEKKIAPSHFFLLPVLLFMLLIFLVSLDVYFKTQIIINTTKPSPFEFTLSSYPLFTQNVPPDLTANGVVILDTQTKKIIYSKNPDIRFSPASTTKIMTALTALSYFKPDDILTVKSNDIDSVLGLRAGQSFRFTDLMYAMMLPSDNRAAFVIAENYPGGKEEFVAKMNQNAVNLGLKDTHFGDPAGLLDDKDYTTPFDLAYLGAVAMQNETIRKIAGTSEILISSVNENQSFDLFNLNRLLDFDGVVGLKTGHTDEAGDVLVTAKNEQGHLIIIVVMNSQDRFSDTTKILDFLRGRITFLSIHP